MNGQITFRREEEKDYRAVEELVRESFWNVYRPAQSFYKKAAMALPKNNTPLSF